MDTNEEELKPRMSRRKKICVAAAVIAGFIILAYAGTAFYFTTHFLMNTTINGHDFSAGTVAEADAFFKERMKEYSLKITARGDKTDVISGKDISLTCEASENLKKVLAGQNAFLWPKAFWNKHTEVISVSPVYDKDQLEKAVQSMNAASKDQSQPKSASFKYADGKFSIVPEEQGSAVNIETLKQKVVEAIGRTVDSIDLDQEKCYETPKYTAKDEQVQKACESLNRYCNANITYTMSENVVIDKSLISTWVSADADMNVKLNEEAVRTWLKEFGNTYNIIGRTKEYTTPGGLVTTATDDSYSKCVDEEKEFAEIKNALENGSAYSREPVYIETGGEDTGDPGYVLGGYGGTFIEVNLSSQHMWYVENGAVVLETDVVTGEPISSKITPKGTFKIVEKMRNKVLTGNIVPETGEPEYRTPVSYWMRVTWSGIGFHDATWQSRFGGTRNQIPGVGSHGCINMPIGKAAELYDLISVGTPVTIHY